MANWWDEYPDAETKGGSPAGPAKNWWDEYPDADSSSKDIVDTASDAGGYVLDALKHGAAREAKGIQRTAGPGIISNTLQAVSDLDPAGYKPADVHWNRPSTWKDIPKALLESTPEISTDLAAGGAGTALGGMVLGPPGALIGGVLGTGGSMAARSWSDRVKAAATARGHETPTKEDERAALLSLIPDSILARIGLKVPLSAPAAKAGVSVLRHTLQQGAKAAATDAVTNVAQTAIDKTILEKQAPTIDEVGDSAFMGGVTGAALRAPAILKDLSIAKRNKDVSPDLGGRLADILVESNGGKAPKSTAEDYKALIRAKDALSATSDVLTNNTELPTIESQLAIRRVNDAIKRRDTNASSDIQVLREQVGDTQTGAKLVDSLELQHELGKLLNQGNLDEKHGTFGRFFLHPHLPGPLAKLGTLGVGVALPQVNMKRPVADFIDRFQGVGAGESDYSHLPPAGPDTAPSPQLPKIEIPIPADVQVEPTFSDISGRIKEWKDLQRINKALDKLRTPEQRTQVTTPKKVVPVPETKVEPIPSSASPTVEHQVRQAFNDLSGQPAMKNVRLKALRDKLGHIPREELDMALTGMRERGEANFSKLSNPRDIEAEGDSPLSINDQKFHTIWVNDEVPKKTKPEEAPTETSSPPDFHSITVRGITVTQPKSGIGSVEGWKNGVRERLTYRGRAIDEMKGAVRGKAAKRALDGLEKSWAMISASPEQAYSLLEDLVNSDHIPESEKSRLYDIWNKYDLEATWQKSKPSPRPMDE
jgi:hypothetical protein